MYVVFTACTAAARLCDAKSSSSLMESAVRAKSASALTSSRTSRLKPSYARSRSAGSRGLAPSNWINFAQRGRSGTSRQRDIMRRSTDVSGFDGTGLVVMTRVRRFHHAVSSGIVAAAARAGVTWACCEKHSVNAS